MKSALSIIFLLLVIFPFTAFCEESLTWKTMISPQVGEFKFTYNKDEKNIIVYSMRSKSIIQKIPVPFFTNKGDVEFMDLDDDGYKDLVIYSPFYGSSNPIPSGEVWVYSSNDSQFIQNEEFSGNGYVEKAKQHGCVMITNRSEDKYNYSTEYWCFDKKTQKWKLIKTLKNHRIK